MSKDQKKTMNINVETVDNLIETLEWMIGTINFWNINGDYPYNLIVKVATDWYYEIKKLRAANNHDSKQTKKTIKK